MCKCGHVRADHASDDYDLTLELGPCLICSCKHFQYDAEYERKMSDEVAFRRRINGPCAC